MPRLSKDAQFFIFHAGQRSKINNLLCNAMQAALMSSREMRNCYNSLGSSIPSIRPKARTSCQALRLLMTRDMTAQNLALQFFYYFESQESYFYLKFGLKNSPAFPQNLLSCRQEFSGVGYIT